MAEIGVPEGMQEPEEKKHGLAHLFAASTYSAAGLRRALGESAFRQEVIFFAAALALFFWIGASVAEFLGLTIVFLLMFGVEALNTAIEELVVARKRAAPWAVGRFFEEWNDARVRKRSRQPRSR